MILTRRHDPDHTATCDACGRGCDRYVDEAGMLRDLARRGWTFRRRWQWRPPFVATVVTCGECNGEAS